MRRCLVLALLVSVCPMAFAQAYKWKDAQGVVHYADSPPPRGTPYQTIRTPGAVQAPAASPTPPPAMPVPTATATGASAGGPADTPANRARLCDQLRRNVDVLNKEQVVSVDDGNGGTRPLDDAGRRHQLETAQAQMTLYCK